MENYNILFIDDDKNIISVYRDIMALSPYSYKIATTGEEALQLIETMSFDIFIVDINLRSKELSGVDLGVVFRKKFKDAKIYAMTGYSNIFDSIEPSVAGFDKVLSKGFGFTELVEQIKKDLTGNN